MKGHQYWNSRQALALGFNPDNTDKVEQTFSWNKQFTINVESFKSGNPVESTHMECYTDGSLMETHAGYA